MSITSAKTGATGISLALENNFMEPIASTIVGSGGTFTLSFNDIPQTYKHLQIRSSSINSSAGSILLTFNSDTSTVCFFNQLIGDGASASSSGSTNYPYNQIAYNNGSSTAPCVFVSDILDYANINKHKTVRTLSGTDVNGSGGYIIVRSSVWPSTASIESITISTQTGSFAQHSRFSLYGIKG